MSETLDNAQAEYARVESNRIAQRVYDLSRRAQVAEISSNPNANLSQPGTEFSYVASRAGGEAIDEGLKYVFKDVDELGRVVHTSRHSYTTRLPAGTVSFEHNAELDSSRISAAHNLPKGMYRFLTNVEIDPVAGTISGMCTRYLKSNGGWDRQEENQLDVDDCMLEVNAALGCLLVGLEENEQQRAFDRNSSARKAAARYIQQLPVVDAR